jgi:hypothetical protein
MKSTVLKGALAAAVAASAIAATAVPASAEIVCNRWHECWTVHRHVVYPRAAGVIYHRDSWRRAHERAWHWREEHRDDRGYWRNGVWIHF